MASPHSTGLVRALQYHRGWSWHLILLAITAALFAASWSAAPPDLSKMRAYLLAVGDALGAA